MVFAMDHRLALLLYMLLLLAAAVPVAIAWLLLLPQEREPFASSDEKPSGNERDIFAVFLLVNITLSLLLRIPGIDADALSVALAKWISPEWADHVVRIGLYLVRVYWGTCGCLLADSQEYPALAASVWWRVHAFVVAGSSDARQRDSRGRIGEQGQC